jgi:hypothetical protein
VSEVISAKPDSYINLAGETINYLGSTWLTNAAPKLIKAINNPGERLEIDISNIDKINLYEWTIIISGLLKACKGAERLNIVLDFFGKAPNRLLEPNDFLGYVKGDKRISEDVLLDYSQSKRLYNIVGFLEALNTSSLFMGFNPDTRFSYSGLETSSIDFQKKFYKGPLDEPTVLLGLKKISTKSNCLDFVDDGWINDWRNRMAVRFEGSTPIHTEEVWRVFFHELAVNVWEHSDCDGVASLRIIEHLDNYGNLKQWVSNNYPSLFCKRLESFKDGLLELTISDSGLGIGHTLKPSLQNALDSSGMNSKIVNSDVLMYAFDVLGTCKSADERWTVDRHALCRVLSVVNKYHGILRVRSSGCDVVYIGGKGPFKRRNDGFGYIPTKIDSSHSQYNLGTHYQIILPLHPDFNYVVNRNRKSIYSEYLPANYEKMRKVRDRHLVPVLEVTGNEEKFIARGGQRKFQQICKKLCDDLMKTRPSSQPIIFDFSRIKKWTASQFETFIYILKNVIETRPVLLVEMSDNLLDQIIYKERTEEGAQTTLSPNVAGNSESITGKAFGELSEKGYLGFLSLVHRLLLVVNDKGKKYFIGVRNDTHEKALLQLVDGPLKENDILNYTYDGHVVEKDILRCLLSEINPLFSKDKDDNWKIFWDVYSLNYEVRDVIVDNIDGMVGNCKAWYKKTFNGEELYFNLPWQEKWREDFFESRKIFESARYLDEIAQRLIFRLTEGLKLHGKDIRNIKTLSAVTAPALMLAFAMHRWWPTEVRPIISDLSYYCLLGKEDNLPKILNDGEVVVVQDVLDTGNVSGIVIDLLIDNKIDVAGIISFVKLTESVKAIQVNDLHAWEKDPNGIPVHSMISLKRPNSVDGKDVSRRDDLCYWVEPRSLRPIRYSTLRREFNQRGRDIDLEKRDYYLEKFDNLEEGCLFKSGHYVYGQRHYSISVNIKEALNGEIGSEIAIWVADVCSNRKRRKKEHWESDEGFKFEGDVSIVLMPMHSQIHYIWPKISQLLANRDRKQVFYLLDATLFGGSGTAYQLPEQLKDNINELMIRALKSPNVKGGCLEDSLSIFILDDALATSRTAETILHNIIRSINKSFNLNRASYKDKIEDYPRIIRWIKYFAAINLMSHSRHNLWKNTHELGSQKIPFVMEQYAPFMGVPVYNKDSCPMCKNLKRLNHIREISFQMKFEDVTTRIDSMIEDIYPIAIDSASFEINSAKKLPKSIDIISKRKPVDSYKRYLPRYIDTAIWRFLSLMYYSYPPNDIINSFEDKWAPKSSELEFKKEYEKFRLAVLTWCIDNWKRIKANNANGLVLSKISEEIDKNSGNIICLIDRLSKLYNENDVKEFIKIYITKICALEKEVLGGDEYDSDKLNLLITLSHSLQIFFINLPLVEIGTGNITDQQAGNVSELINHLKKSAVGISEEENSLLRIIYTNITRPRRHVKPAWALSAFIESVYRFRSGKNSLVSGHLGLFKYLRDWLDDKRNERNRLLMRYSISTLVMAIEDLSCQEYIGSNAKDISRVIGYCKKILEHLNDDKCLGKNAENIPETEYLASELLEGGEFYDNFQKILHPSIENIINDLKKATEDMQEKGYSIYLNVIMDKDVEKYRLLVNKDKLINCILNYAVGPITDIIGMEGKRVVNLINIKKTEHIDYRLYLEFQIYTAFLPYEKARDKIYLGQSNKLEKYNLDRYGVIFVDEVEKPKGEIGKKYSVLIRIRVPTGYLTEVSS